MHLTQYLFHPVKDFNLLSPFRLRVHCLPPARQIAPVAVRQLIYVPFCTFLSMSAFATSCTPHQCFYNLFTKPAAEIHAEFHSLGQRNAGQTPKHGSNKKRTPTGSRDSFTLPRALFAPAACEAPQPRDSPEARRAPTPRTQAAAAASGASGPPFGGRGHPATRPPHLPPAASSAPLPPTDT